jgi:uncharacterized protein YjbI with pentapeptide repeats
MEPTIRCGKHVAEHADLAGSRFCDVNLADAEFDDVNMRHVKLHNINLSDIAVSAVQMGGASFCCVGLPPGTAGKQRPLRFENCDFNGSTFRRCDLSNVALTDCDVSGMKIDGVAVDELLRAYRQQSGPRGF